MHTCADVALRACARRAHTNTSECTFSTWFWWARTWRRYIHINFFTFEFLLGETACSVTSCACKTATLASPSGAHRTLPIEASPHTWARWRHPSSSRVPSTRSKKRRRVVLAQHRPPSAGALTLLMIAVSRSTSSWPGSAVGIGHGNLRRPQTRRRLLRMAGSSMRAPR